MPGGTAKPPATGQDERQVAAVREVVRRLPWGEWAKLRNPEWRLTPVDADAVQGAICEAMASTGITLDQVAAIGQAALSEAQSDQPVTYVTNAFTKHLTRRLRALAVEPLADNPLPLLATAKPQASAPKPAKSGKDAAAGPDEAAPTKPVLPACPTCEAREGEGLGGRTVVGDDGRHRPCPDCRPAAA